MNEFNVTIENFNDLSPVEQDSMPQAGKQYASYVRVRCYGETILLKSDAIEPEDKTFFRELSWIKEALEKAYEAGVDYASQEPDATHYKCYESTGIKCRLKDKE